MAYKGQNAPQLDDDDLTEEQREEDEENSYTVGACHIYLLTPTVSLKWDRAVLCVPFAV